MDPLFIIEIVALLITGIAVGTVSGMLGVGGCFIMIPVQFWVLTAMGVDPTIAIRVAFGTNLLVVLPTAISSSIKHNKENAILWKESIILGVFGAASGVGGAFVASLLPGSILTIIFGVAILIGSIRMITAKPIKIEEEVDQKKWHYVIAGLVIGFATGLIGIGGGVLMVPVLVIGLNFQMRKAVGSSTAMMILTSLGGAISYMILGLGQSGLPPLSIGYVNIFQWILLAGTSIPMAQVGAYIAHKIKPAALKWIFIIVMIYMGLKMIGVFSWLGLPI
ncbi:MAG: sulfite exporter TauE/SafE family protein [Candidatus Helarchaeota archaeon]